MIRNILFAFSLVMLVVTSTARSEISSTITITSDYDYRGLTQTARDPALQASIDWEGESGFYVGVFGSNVEFGDGTDTEIDLYAGFRGSVTDELAFDVGVLQYTYHPGASDIDFVDLYAGMTYKSVSAKYWYSWDVSNTGLPGSYFELNSSIALSDDLSLDFHGGYSFGDYWAGEDYFDYSIGLSKSIRNFSFSLKWVDGSDLKSARNAPDDLFTSDAKVVFSVSTTLPWGE